MTDHVSTVALPAIDDENESPDLFKPGFSVIPEDKQNVPKSNEGEKWYYKENFCFYCHTLQNRFDRHLLLNHGDKELVRLLRPSLHVAQRERERERGQWIKELRLRDNEIYNKNKFFNPDGKII